MWVWLSVGIHIWVGHSWGEPDDNEWARFSGERWVLLMQWVEPEKRTRVHSVDMKSV